MMKKTILHIATAVMLLAIFTACEKEALQAAFEGNNGKSIRILLNAQGDDVTRAVSSSDGNDAYGENTIATADVFFYNADGTLIYNVAKENVTLSEPDANGVVTATVPMPSSDENIDLTQATKVYVMGNRQATDAQVASAKTSEAGLRALTFTTTSLDQEPTAETTFAMDGTGEITVAGNEISGTVELVRAAAKITLEVNLPSTLTADDKTYKPQTTGITVTFNKGVKTFGDETDMFNVGQRVGIDGTADAEGNTPVSFEPFYSYPTTWKTGEDNEPYFTLHVPWGETNSEGSVTSYTTYHYRVPINKTNFDKDENGTNLTTLSLKRNHWYQVSVNVGVLGTPEASDEVELTANYEVKPWGNLPIGANLLDFKYLVVDQLNINMDNIETSNNIGYKSSSPITVKVTSIKFWDYYYSENTPSKEITINGANYWTYSEITKNEKTSSMTSTTKYTDNNSRYNNDKYTTSWNEKTFFLNHPFKKTANNVIDTYVKYEITLLVSNDDGLTETVTINQYPPIYIEGEVNPDVKNKTNNGTYPNRGYVIINNRNDANGSYWEDANSLSGDNKNTSMYVIHVTTLINSAYSNFLVGESREKKDSKTFTGAKEDDLGNALEHLYYSDNNNLSIAPTFRIASSFGVVYPISFDDAKRRCAGYQEAGYKAGRWRIPTESEAKFICGLSNDGKIPLLFTTNYEYWVSTGKTIKNAEINNTIPSSAYVRCVYDEWYWGNDRLTDYTQFVWGNNKVY